MLTDEEKKILISDERLKEILSDAYGDRLLSERELMKLIYQAGVEAEREACAVECDNRIWAIDDGGKKYFRPDHAERCAQAIRARSKK